MYITLIATLIINESQFIGRALLSHKPRATGGSGGMSPVDERWLSSQPPLLRRPVPRDAGGGRLGPPCDTAGMVCWHRWLFVWSQEMVKLNRLVAMVSSLKGISRRPSRGWLWCPQSLRRNVHCIHNQPCRSGIKRRFASLKTLGSWVIGFDK
jgi:hypothetical protein